MASCVWRCRYRSLAGWFGVSIAIAATMDHVMAAPGDRPAAAAEASTSSAPLRRLTRFEYANSLRDLFGMEFPFTDELPVDGQAEGFDNNGDALALTPLLLEGYLKVARKAGERVLGTDSSAALTESFRAGDNQAGWIEGLPMSTRGGMRLEHDFPRDGEYELRALLDYVLPGGRRISRAFPLAPVEGVRSSRQKLTVPAGLHTIYVTFPDEYSAREGAVPNLKSAVGERPPGGPVDIHASAIRPAVQFWLDGRKLQTRQIGGPDPSSAAINAQPGLPLLDSVEITGPMHAAAGIDTPARRQLMVCTPRRVADERRCAARILERVARRAYRREIADVDMQPVMAAFTRKRRSASFDAAIGMGLTTILVSPDFLFRVELDPPEVAPGQNYRVSDQELGTRLFLRTLLRENRSILEVIASDYTYLNERLAKLYGIDGVTGSAFRRVALSQVDHRGGVISQASVLMASSHPARTSPILRGKWILTNLMNSPPPNPPAGVPALDTAPATDGRKLTTREQIERHRGSPVCASCHSKMDPYGIALENYDVLGRWRTEENGLPLDTSTALPRGAPFTGPAGLKQTLLARSDEFVAATVSRLMTYALGRKLEANDQATVRNIVQAVKPGGYRFADIIVQIANSTPFQTRRKRTIEATQS